MPMGGQGPWAVAVMWMVTVVAAVFVALRAYTRILVVQSYGIDDHVYNFAFALLVCYTATTTVAAHYGFGQNMADIIDVEDLVKAILFEAIGQTFAVVGMAVAKWSLGLFLLRLVTKAWHKVAIWVTMGSLMAASISVCFVFWLQCTPPAYLYDRRIPGGYCHINTTPVSFTLCILCVLADFFFALFPWLFLWNLQMNQREKMIIALSLSLGLFAGACGIKRTVEVPSLSSANYLNDTVGLIVWSAAEIAVTMICIGIPICRPLYKHWLDRLLGYASGAGSGGYQKQKGQQQQQGGRSGDNSSRQRGYGLRTFGGGTMPGTSSSRWRPETTTNEGADSSSDVVSESDGKGTTAATGVPGTGGRNKNQKQHGKGAGEVKLGLDGPFNEATAVGGMDWNGSEEEILGLEFRTDGGGRGSGGKKSADDLESARGHGHGPHCKASIQVTEEWRIDRTEAVSR
ncbi:hypothetical protein C8A01DRAFT_40508 [Parachaetomium inaequale]|uniref:Rhodopsin domain-containing protein n=1 Tax=Parachaetomium inaequale TaxID=2588326 RepID=A0AAN6SLR1_9PEZI|nr:hypothetical protein C8A01DRAFT_40508 [Parachaetomium inaequale]